MFDKGSFPIIEHLKSGLSVSSHFGCPLRCPYCLIHAGSEDNQQAKMVASAEDLIKKLTQPESLFLNGMTPIIINNRTDPFLPNVQEHTFRILELLCEQNIHSPVLLISKLFPSQSIKPFCKVLPILFIYSYSALCHDMNYSQIKNVDQLSNVVPNENMYHYMRPIIPGINDNPQELLYTLQKFANFGFQGSIISGIRVTSGNLEYLGIGTESISSHKTFLPETFQTILTDPVLIDARYPVFRHTSCAIDYHMKRPNRLGYYLHEEHCNPTCKNRPICSNQHCFPIEKNKAIEARFPGMSFTPVNGKITIHSPVSQEIIAFIKNAYGIQVIADKVLLSPSEEVLSNG